MARPLIGVTTGHRLPATDRETPIYTAYTAIAENVARAGACRC
ncbi:MAG: hypothetical protein UZ13_02214 [Chloroflexi bacterium OLB13]|nr:MAG: hypothetical protein UZ13_02214 [Chloroflexi bacterium OLB13]